MRRAPWMFAVAVAVWPTWGWIGRRAVDGSDDPWGLLALAALLTMAARAPVAPSLPRHFWLPSAALLTIYAASYATLPPLMRGAIALSAVATLATPLYLGRRFHLGLWGLCVLALPLEASLQFYAGYPLRTLVAHLGAAWLRASGVLVEADGVALRHGAQSVLVDAPCSGVRMLWVAALVTCLLCCRDGLSNARQAIVALLGGAIVIVANTVRATALFYGEAGLVTAPSWGHEATGLLVFALALACIGLAAERLRPSRPIGEGTP